MAEVRRLAVAVVLSVALGVGTAGAAPPSSPGSPAKGESTKKGESAKEPGKNCDKLTRNSDTFKDCRGASQKRQDEQESGQGEEDAVTGTRCLLTFCLAALLATGVARAAPRGKSKKSADEGPGVSDSLGIVFTDTERAIITSYFAPRGGAATASG
jgi:hypothetical protein